MIEAFIHEHLLLLPTTPTSTTWRARRHGQDYDLLCVGG